MNRDDFVSYLVTTKAMLIGLQNKREKHLKLSEADTKNKIIYPLLALMGYQEDEILREEREGNSKKRSDILISATSNVHYFSSEQIVIETKSFSHKLSKSDTKDLITKYMLDKSPRWGILTNGNEYKLYGKPFTDFNNELELYTINLDLKNIDTSNQDEMGKVFNQVTVLSKKSLVNSIYASSLKMLSEYLTYLKDNSKGKDPNKTLRVYKDEIECFINFMMNKYPKVKFNQINDYYVEQFAEYRVDLVSRRGKINKVSRLTTVIEYVLSFLAFCHDSSSINYYNPDIKNIPTAKLVLQVFKNKNLSNKSQRNRAKPFTKEELIKTLKLYKEEIKQKKSEDIEPCYLTFRDYVFLVLGLFTGAKKADLLNLKWSDIRFSSSSITVGNKEYILSNSMTNILKDYKNIYDSYISYAPLKDKQRYLFVTAFKNLKNKQDGVTKISDGTFNTQLRTFLRKVGLSEQRIKDITVESLAITTVSLVLEKIKIFSIITEIIDKNMTITDLRNVFKHLGYVPEELVADYIEEHPINNII